MNRVLYKIFFAGLNLIVSAAIIIMVARTLGAVAFGNLSYVLATYAFLFQFLMVMSETAYVYYLAEKKHDHRDLNTFILIFISLVTFLILVISLVSTNSELGILYLWNGLTNYHLLYLGLICATFLNLQKVLLNYSDSTSQTIRSENIKLLTRVLTVLLLIVLISYKSLNVYSYLILLIVGLMLFFGLFAKYIEFKFSTTSKQSLKDILKDFSTYLGPLTPFLLVAAVYSYIGKYVLQSSAGSAEQGYYNLAFQLALVPVTILSSVTPIIMSEVTAKFSENNLQGVRNIFLDYVFKIYTVHAFISFFVVFNAEQLILLTVGRDFIGAVIPLQVLSIFSLFHSFGIFNSILFLSTGRNKQYSNVNSIAMAVGIIYLIYIFFAGSLTAIHLAMFMTLIYVIRTIFLLYQNIIFLTISEGRFFLELVFLTLILIALFAIVDFFDLNMFFNFILSTLFFLTLNFIFSDYLGIKAFLVASKDKITSLL